MKLRELYKLATQITRIGNKFLNFANWVALISVVVGSIALLLSLSILDGFDNKLKETAIQFTSDICVQTINGSDIADVTEKQEQLLEHPNVINVVPVLQTEAICSSPKYTEGVVLQSIDVVDDIKKFRANIVAGEFSFTSDTAREVIISASLARKLNVGIDDKLLIYALTNKEYISFSSATYTSFKVKALYNTGMYQYDNSVLFFPFTTLTTFLEKPINTATYFECYVQDLSLVSETARQIDNSLGFPIFSATYYEINRSIFSWIELQKEPIPIVLAIISLVASLNIITMLIITVVEKSHTIGILRAVGMQAQYIIQMFIILSIRTAGIGVFIGLLLSLGFVELQRNFGIISLDSKIYFVDSLPINMRLEYIIGVVGLTLIFALLASLIPSVIAVKISPLKTIRFQ